MNTSAQSAARNSSLSFHCRLTPSARTVTFGRSAEVRFNWSVFWGTFAGVFLGSFLWKLVDQAEERVADCPACECDL